MGELVDLTAIRFAKEADRTERCVLALERFVEQLGEKDADVTATALAVVLLNHARMHGINRETIESVFEELLRDVFDPEKKDPATE